MFLKKFHLLNEIEEEMFVHNIKTNIHFNYYPVQIFTPKRLSDIEFEPITIFYGNNGSGKSTLLNILARFYNANIQNKSSKGFIFDDYLNTLNFYNDEKLKAKEIKYITSDDIFENMLNVRAINSGVKQKKEDLIEEYYNYKYADITAWNNLEELKKMNESRKKSQSKYVMTNIINNNILEKSNGETSLIFLQQQIEENGLYFLDEPENSLSPPNQLKLKKYIEEAARFFNCQFIIATHSPILLKLNEALIYDLDSSPCITKEYDELESIKVYQELFKDN